MSRQGMEFFDASFDNELDIPVVATASSLVNIPAHYYEGAWASGGSDSTTLPHVFISNGLATVSGFDTNGTGLGLAAQSGFTGTFLDAHKGGPSIFSVDHNGAVGVRSAATPTTAPLFVPWQSGDSAGVIAYIGSNNAGNDQTAIRADTASGIGVLGAASGSGIGVQGTASSGYGVYGSTGSGTAVAGVLSDAGTTNAPPVVTVSHITSGTPGVGFGGQIALQAQSTTTVGRSQAVLSGVWVSATDASRKARLTAYAYDAAAAREGWRIEATGTAAAIGFLGAAAIARQTLTGAKAGNVALANLITVLAAFGIIIDSTT